MARRGSHVPMPAGLSAIQVEVAYTIGQFQRLVSHNRGVYGELYEGIVAGVNLPPKYPDELDGNFDPSFLKQMSMLRTPYLDETVHAQIAASQEGNASAEGPSDPPLDGES